MLVRNRSLRTRWTISLSWPRSDSTTKSTAEPLIGRQARGPFPDVSADDVEHQVDATDVFKRVAVEINKLLSTGVERFLTVGSTPGSHDVSTSLSCELRHHCSDRAVGAVREEVLTRLKAPMLEQPMEVVKQQ